MPTRKISDEKSEHKPCFSPDHNPPSHRVFSPGLYEHECSACGKKTVFRVQGIYCVAPMPANPYFSHKISAD